DRWKQIRKRATPASRKNSFGSEFTHVEYREALLMRLLTRAMGVLLTLRAECSLVALKPAHSSRFLPAIPVLRHQEFILLMAQLRRRLRSLVSSLAMQRTTRQNIKHSSPVSAKLTKRYD